MKGIESISELRSPAVCRVELKASKSSYGIHVCLFGLLFSYGTSILVLFFVLPESSYSDGWKKQSFRGQLRGGCVENDAIPRKVPWRSHIIKIRQRLVNSHSRG
jgi:hypothetical protein